MPDSTGSSLDKAGRRMRTSQICGLRLLQRSVQYPDVKRNAEQSKYAAEANIIFGIMNEPHNIPDMKIWAESVQAAVTAIRNAGATTQMILLPGNDFTGAQNFVSNGSAGNLSNVHNLDGSNTSLIFDVHKYLDVDGSGTHTECVQSHVNETFSPLAQFLVANGRMAMLSEIGGGNTASVSSQKPTPHLHR